ncbi:zf-HC2 domain-containing protein [Streptomyces sp. RKAG290]|uniref:anti-sigma factor family protein n=1 Tax=Streptomyces sp. RKAG290 TaxID=2888348 RepID=UPI0027E26F17|nr:zf-HC2 domain-containing protein [Streptomyces sp. RKAG290]
MRTPELHRDVGAYALGVLGAADAFRFEEHLGGCPLCSVRAAEFGGVTAVLARYAGLTPPGVAPVVRAGPELVRRATGRWRTAGAGVADGGWRCLRRLRRWRPGCRSRCPAGCLTRRCVRRPCGGPPRTVARGWRRW